MKRSHFSWAEGAMLAPALLLVTVFVVIPFAMSIGLALTNQPLVPGPIPAKVVWLRNFQRILNNGEFWRAFENVLLFAVMVIPLQCGFALLMAILLNNQRRAKRVFQAFFFLPYVTPMVVVCVVWATMFQYPTGLLNSVLTTVSFGFIKPVEWLGNPVSALPA